MSDNRTAIDGYVYVTKDIPDVIRDTVLSLLVQKYPEKLSEQEISDFVQQCYIAIKLATVAPTSSQ